MPKAQCGAGTAQLLVSFLYKCCQFFFNILLYQPLWVWSKIPVSSVLKTLQLGSLNNHNYPTNERDLARSVRFMVELTLSKQFGEH